MTFRARGTDLEARLTELSNRHVGPTLARIGGAELPGMGDGRFLLAKKARDDGADGEAFFQTMKGKWGGSNRAELYGLRVGARVLQWDGSGAGGPEGVRLFDLTTDPGERYDVSAEESEACESLLETLRERLEAQRAFRPEYVIGVGASGQRTLAGVGYLGDDSDADGDDEDD